MRAFSSQFSTTSWEKHLFGPPLWLSPDRCIADSSKTAGLHSRQCPFSYRGKSHSVRLRGVDPIIHRKRPNKERLKIWFVLTKKSEAWLLVACCCCQGHATAPTHHIGRLCKWRALFVLARRELSVGGVFRRLLKRAIFNFWRGKSPRFRPLQTRAQEGSVENCKLWHRPNMNGGSAAR